MCARYTVCAYVCVTCAKERQGKIWQREHVARSGQAVQASKQIDGQEDRPDRQTALTGQPTSQSTNQLT